MYYKILVELNTQYANYNEPTNKIHPTKFMNINPKYQDQNERAEIAQTLANDMGYMFDNVLSSSVGNIYVM